MDYPYLDTVIYDNFYELLRGRNESSFDVPAIKYRRKSEIISLSYHDMICQIAKVYFCLKERGLRGKHIAILSENRYEYIIIYLAAIFDSVIVPLDKELDEETISDCIKSFDVDACFYTNKTAAKVKEAGVSLINIDDEYESITTDNFSDDRVLEAFWEEVKDTDKDRFCTLASTSGTDGRMKGVMLSQYNIITNIRGTLENNVLESPTLAMLPMNHTYGFNPCILASIYNGTTVCLCLAFKDIYKDIKAYDPFFFGAVPMIIEGLYDNIEREIARQGKTAGFERLIKISRFFLKFHIDLRHLFFGKILSPGLRLIVSGGAALNADYVEKYDRIGIKLLNGYGMTECSPTIAVSREFNNVQGSAGTIMKHIDVKIADDGEILVTGPCVMLGYYKDEEATRTAIQDGYYHTGDIGYTDGKVLFVTGRKKNLIILDNGKNVAPEFIEDKINKIPYVKESLVVPKKTGEKTSVLLAKIVVDDSYFNEKGSSLHKDSDRKNLTDSEKQAMLDNNNKNLIDNVIENQIEKDIAAINDSLPSYMKIDDFEIMETEFKKNSSGKIVRKEYV